MRCLSPGCKLMLASILATALGCQDRRDPAPPPAPEAPSSEGLVLTLGGIEPDDPVRVLEAMEPLARHLEGALSPIGVGRVRVQIAPDTATMTEWMQRGEVEVFLDSPFPALIVSEGSGARVVLRRWKGGVSSYHSVLFTRTDSDVVEIGDLRGASIAFDDPASTTGYLLPMAMLRQAGLDPIAEGDPRERSEDSTSYSFAGDDTVVVQWVLSERSKAGAVDDVTYREIPAETRRSLRVLGESAPVPRHLVLIGAGVEARLEQAVTAALLELEQTETGRAALEALKSTRFDVPEGGVDEMLSQIRELRHRAAESP